MNQLLKWSVKYEVLKGNMKSVLKSKKGSPTMEYVVIIGIGAAFAGLLAFVFSDGGAAQQIKDAFKEKVLELINGNTKTDKPAE